MTSRCTVLLLALLLAAPAVWGQEKPVLVRFYYSQWLAGTVDRTPLDPTGAYADESPSARAKGDLELILLRRVGLSYTRQHVDRGFRDDTGATTGCAAPPCAVEEQSLQQALNLTLYLRGQHHNAFNAFAGYGRGKADYQYKVDGVPQELPDLHKGMTLRRWFAGIEYTFRRIGFRLEWTRARAASSYAGQEAELEQHLRYLSVYIPFN